MRLPVVRQAVLLLGCVFGLSAETISFLGDSITAGYGLAEAQAYPALIQAELVRRGSPWTVINAGVSGDTTAGGLHRVAWLLKAKPAIVVIALGANDGLRGLPIEQIDGNLRQILQRIQAAGVKPLLVGMQLPTNYGVDYRTRFAALFPAIAEQSATPLYPFLLTGVAADQALNQADGIHPNAAGQQIIATQMLTFLAPHLGLR